MIIREANQTDLVHIINLLADDELGRKREEYKIPIPTSYQDAFQKIDQDPNQRLIVVEDQNDIIGTAQLSFIQYLTYQGGVRAQIEAIRIKSNRRGSGIGEVLIKWIIAKAKQEGAHLLQLTSDKERPQAIRFYEKLGFVSSHQGLKMHFQ